MGTAKKGKSRIVIIVIWLAALSPFVLGGIVFLLISLGAFGFMPTFEELENPKSALASEVISADHVVLGNYYLQNRTNCNFSELSPNVINALVATEDARFYSHSGIDFRSIFRVVFKNMLFGKRSAGGGSTITQQLAKNLFPRAKNASKLKVIFIKLKEWVTAIKLERNYTKQEIIAMYLNTVDFGSLSFGIKSAARTYFNKTPKELNIQEAAVLIGLLKAPSYYSPVRFPERAKMRRDVVLYQMMNSKYITEDQFDSIKKLPVNMSEYKIQDHKEGLATYFREYLRGYLMDWCTKKYKADGSPYNLYKDGLRIYTTINSKMQKYAELSVKEHLSKLQKIFFKHWKGVRNAPFDATMTPQMIEDLLKQAVRRSDRYIRLKEQDVTEAEIKRIFKKPVKMKLFTWAGERDTVLSPMDSIIYYKHFLQCGLMSVEPTTGFIRAYVGGINYEHFQYDHVIVGKRQVGSTFKPFVYALAMQEGEFKPCDKVPNIPVSFSMPDSTVWTPKNSGGTHEGEMITLKWALANSVNNVSAYLMKRYKPEAVVQIAKKMGITSPIIPVPSICLGTIDLSLYEMVGANCTFVNKGRWIEPIFITRIEDKDGNIIEEFVPKKQEAISEETALLMIALMKGVVEYGTGCRLRFEYKLMNPIAGKTGTTQNNSDGWFIGLTPPLVTGVWVGNDDRSAHFRTMEYGQGAVLALPIWGIYMKKIYGDKSLNLSKDDFEGLHKLNIDMDCEKFESNKKKKQYEPSDRY